MQIEVAGENALIAYLGEGQSPAVSARVQALADLLPGLLGASLIDQVPSYASLLILFDPLQTDQFAVRAALRRAETQLADRHTGSGKLVELPVYYSTESGPDLKQLATDAGLSTEAVIEIHQSTEYRVYAIGFAPGFAYLGEVDSRIATPRLATPRQRVPKGAVAIADAQTAVYPAVSPGGWNLIGLCPTPMFQPENKPHMPVQVGDRVRFKAIDRATYIELGGEL